MTAPLLQAAGFVIGAIFLTCALHALIWRRLVRKALPVGWHNRARRVVLALAALLPFGMVLLLFMRHMPRWLNSPLMTTVFLWLGVAIFLFWAVLAFEILRFILRPAAKRQVVLARICIAVALAVSAYAVIEASAPPQLVVTQFTAAPELSGYRIVLLTDLHIGHTLGTNFAEGVVRTVNSLDADLIVIGGDMVDGSVSALTDSIMPLRQLQARDGIVFILGNHEYLSGAESWVQEVSSFGWHVLRNDRLVLPRLEIIGVDDSSPVHIVSASAGGKPRVLVAHEPDAFKEACRAHIELALAGHTHGGQIFPFGLVDWLQHGYLAGPYRCGSTHLYVSSGAGFWGPPMRLGTHSEITVIEFVEE